MADKTEAKVVFGRTIATEKKVKPNTASTGAKKPTEPATSFGFEKEEAEDLPFRLQGDKKMYTKKNLKRRQELR
jgi:hypothetical protein